MTWTKTIYSGSESFPQGPEELQWERQQQPGEGRRQEERDGAGGEPGGRQPAGGLRDGAAAAGQTGRTSRLSLSAQCAKWGGL